MPQSPSAAAALLVCSALFGGALHAGHPAAPSFPAEATLTEVLGFRTSPGLQAPFAIRAHNYLPVGTPLTLLDSNPAFGTEGAFCKAEALGHRGYFRCDKPHAFKLLSAKGDKHLAAAPRSQAEQQAGSAPQPKGGPARQAPPASGHVKLGAYCRDVESCKTFCQANCKLDLARWGKGVSSTCSFPAGLGGSIATGSPLLKPLPAMKFVKGGSSVRATDQVLAGLQRLDQHLAASSSWPQGHTAFIKSCFRSDVSDSTSECDYVLKGWHIKQKFAATPPSTKAEHDQKANAERMINPPKFLGLMWPGATPHSAGIGCDIVVRDGAGKEVTACRSTAADTKMRAMSKALVDALTNDSVGAVRLNYEGWHFEWGGSFTSCRCKGDDCNDKHWPTLCDGPQHCNKPL